MTKKMLGFMNTSVDWLDEAFKTYLLNLVEGILAANGVVISL